MIQNIQLSVHVHNVCEIHLCHGTCLNEMIKGIIRSLYNAKEYFFIYLTQEALELYPIGLPPTLVKKKYTTSILYF